ncbi:MAG: CotH kinase family protein [Spirochaetales bacterium]|nr:CotH kinase family protein [Spirochaetales bacterium]
MGKLSRNFDMKSLAVIARSEYGGLARDAIIQEVLRGRVDFDLQAYTPVVMYLNGEYWGLINLRERYDEQCLKGHAGLNGKDGVDLVEWDDIAGKYTAVAGDTATLEAMLSAAASGSRPRRGLLLHALDGGDADRLDRGGILHGLRQARRPQGGLREA